MNSLFMVVERILAIFQECTTKQDATNSSKPSLQTDKDESALSHAGTVTAKANLENKAAAQISRTLAWVETCDKQ